MASLIGLLTFVALPIVLLLKVALRAVGAASTSEAERSPAPLGPRLGLTGVILGVSCASIAYRATVDHGLQQTAALFIGVPVILAIVVIFATSPRTATGVACKAVTVGMLLSVLFLWEGFLCVLMAAPLVYLVAIVVSYGLDAARQSENKRTRTLF